MITASKHGTYSVFLQKLFVNKIVSPVKIEGRNSWRFEHANFKTVADACINFAWTNKYVTYDLVVSAIIDTNEYKFALNIKIIFWQSI